MAKEEKVTLNYLIGEHPEVKDRIYCVLWWRSERFNAPQRLGKYGKEF